MKTWEMIKELTEHPEKTFKLIKTTSENSLNGIVKVLDNRICWEEGSEYPIYIVLDELDDWEEVKEPVDFLTAYKDCLENGNKYVVKGSIDTIATLYNSNGNVMIHTLVHGFTLSNEWIKED